MATNIINQAGKGSDPRNNWSKEFRSEHDRIFGNREKRRCPHGILIGDKCDECLRALPANFLGGTGTKKKFKATDIKGS